MILALDIATVTGWALGSLDCEPEAGRFRLPKTGDDIGRFVNAYRDWLVEMIDRHSPSRVVYESPLTTPGPQTNMMTLRKLGGLTVMTESVAVDMAVECKEANLSTIRKHFVGRGRAPKDVKDGRKWFKAAVMDRCQVKGWHPADDNEADALALLDFSLWCLDTGHPSHQPCPKPEKAPQPAPLFEGAAA